MKQIALLLILLCISGCADSKETQLPPPKTKTVLLTPSLSVTAPSHTPIPKETAAVSTINERDLRFPKREDAENLHEMQWNENSIVINDFSFGSIDSAELKVERMGPSNHLFSGIRLQLTLDNMPYVAEFQHETDYSVYPIYIDCVDMDGDDRDEFIVCIPFPGTGLNCDLRVFSFSEGGLHEVITVLDRSSHSIIKESAEAFNQYYIERSISPGCVHVWKCHGYSCFKKKELTVIKIDCTIDSMEWEQELSYDGTILHQEIRPR